jgi:hypothetical protein
VTVHLETGPQPSASDQSRDPQKSSVIDGTDEHTPSKHLLKITSFAKISIILNKRLNHSADIIHGNITNEWQ